MLRKWNNEIVGHLSTFVFLVNSLLLLLLPFYYYYY